MTTHSELLTEQPSPGVVVLRLNRPHAYNALSRELTAALQEAVDQLWQTGARVMVLAASTPGFCSGADLKQRRTMDDAAKYAHNREINALANAIAGLAIPTIAAVDGVAMGGGCELALACDMRFATPGSTIGLTEARIGAMPGAGGSQRLPRLIGPARALEMMFSGEPVAGLRAAEIGLVNDVHAADRLEAEVTAFAGLLAGRSRESGRRMKHAVWQGLDLDLAGGLELERVAVIDILASEDYREGLAAFAERRLPRFN